MTENFPGFDFFIRQIEPRLRTLSSTLFARLLQQFNDCNNDLQQQLLNDARRQNTDQQKMPYIIAVEQIKHLQQEMLCAFGLHLLTVFKPLSSFTPLYQSHQQRRHAPGSRRRLDKDVRVLAEVSAEKYASDCQQLLQRLQTTLPSHHFDDSNNPLSPYPIAQAITGALSLLSIEPKLGEQILSFYQQQFLLNLDEHYLQCLDLMGMATDESLQRGSASTSASPNSFEHQAQPPIVSAVVDEEVLDTIASGFNALINDGTVPPLLGQFDYLTMQASLGEDLSDQLPLSAKALDELLATVQKGYDPKHDGHLIDCLKLELTQAATEQQRQYISQHDENVINLVALLLAQLATLQPTNIGSLIARLIVPYVRVILQDSLFFHDNDHPARKLLEQLMQLSFNSFDDAVLLLQVKHCVTKILLKFEGDAQIFEQLLATVNDNLVNNKADYLHRQQLMQKELSEAESVRQNYQHIHEALQRKFSVISRVLPFHLALQHLWLDILTTIKTEHGEQSSQWRRAYSLLDKVLVLSHDDGLLGITLEDKQLLALQDAVERLLSEHDIDRQWIAAFCQQFAQLYLLLAQRQTLQAIADEELSQTFTMDMIVDHYQSEQMAAIDAVIIGSEHQSLKKKPFYIVQPQQTMSLERAQNRVLSMPCGQWVSYLVDGEFAVCVMSFCSKDKDYFVFCDRYHRRLFQRSFQDFSADIVSAYAVEIDDSLDFDKHLSRVVQALL